MTLDVDLAAMPSCQVIIPGDEGQGFQRNVDTVSS